MNLKRKALVGLVWSLVQNFGNQTFSLIIFLVLARLLTPPTFGLIALANVVLAFMRIFLDQGFTKALIQRQTVEPEHLNTAFWTQVGCGILLTTITFFSADLVAGIFNQPKLIEVLQCLSSIFIINSLSRVHNAILSREFAFKVMALRSLLATVIGGMVGVTMAYAGFGVWSLAIYNLTSEVVALVVLWSAVEWRPKWQFSNSHFRDLYGFGMYIFAFKFIKFFEKRADNLLIGYFLGEVALGYYAIAYRILEVITQLLVDTIDKVALPTFSRLQTEPKRFARLFYQTTQFTSIVTFPTYLGVVVLAPELTISLFGEQWVPATGIMQILAFEGIVLSASYFHKSVFVSMGKPSWSVRVTLLSATVNLIACLVAVRSGIIAVATAYIISSYLVFPISQWAVNRLIKINLLTYLKQFITPLISSTVMVGAIWSAKYYLLEASDPKLSIIVGAVIGVLIYALCIKIFEPQLFVRTWEFVKLNTAKKKRTV